MITAINALESIQYYSKYYEIVENKQISVFRVINTPFYFGKVQLFENNMRKLSEN